jgi:hypothetical protein
MSTQTSDPELPSEPYAPYPDDLAARRATWPTAFGIVSLVVGVLGMCMQGAAVGMSLGGDKIMGLAGMSISPAPRIVQIVGGTQAIICTLLGVMLIIGSRLLIMRKPLGAQLVKWWAITRLIMVVFGLGAVVFTLRAQVEWQITMSSEIREFARGKGIKEADLPPIADRELLEKQAMWGVGIASVGFSVWPFVMAIVLTGRKGREDIAAWSAPPNA